MVSISVWEKAAPPELTLKPDNSVPPHMCLAPFKLLSPSWSSEQVSPLVINWWADPLSKTSMTPVALHLTQPQYLLVFTAIVVGTSPPGTEILGWGASFGAWTPLFSRGTSAAKNQDIPPDF